MNAINIVQVPAPDHKTLWVSKDFGIRSRREFQRHANRSHLQTATDLLSTQLRGVNYSLHAGKKLFAAKRHAIKFPQFIDQAPIGNTDKAQTHGLAVLFHGLNGQPTLWDAHVALLKKTPGIDVFVPQVPDAGHRSLTDDSSYVLLNRIVDWTKKNPGKPVALFGQSNGSRFALLFETWLRERAPGTPVHVSLTAGVMYGTTTVDLTNALLRTNELAVTSLGKLSLVNCMELGFGSDTARRLVGEARKPLPQGTAERDYAMYAPLHDMHVPDTGSGLPILVSEGQEGKKERHYIVSNYGHNAIVTALAKKQINDCVGWMKKFSTT